MLFACRNTNFYIQIYSVSIQLTMVIKHTFKGGPVSAHHRKTPAVSTHPRKPFSKHSQQ